MITWFQRVFGKHFKWVMVAFLVVLLLSFIVSIGAVPRLNMQGNQGRADLFLGVNKNDPDVMKNLSYDVQYTFNMNGMQVSSQQELDRLIDYRIVQMYLADEWHIPEPSSQQMEDFLKSVRAFHNADGHFSAELYQQFKDNLESAPTTQRDTIMALLKQECRLERVRAILGGPGYSLPFVAEAQVALNKIKSDVEVATLDYKTYTPKIDLSGDKLNTVLQDIFTKDPSKFPRPAQMNISYVKFTNATAVDPTAAQLLDYIKQNKDKFPGLNPDSLSDKDKTVLLDAWRAAQKNTAATATKTETLKFAHEISDLKTQMGAAPFKLDAPAAVALLKKYNLTPQVLPTITQGKPAPADSPIPNDILQQASGILTAEQPIQPAPVDDGAVVLFYLNSTPARASTFDEAREDVLKVYTESEKQRQFTDLCKTLHDALVKEIAAGKTFADAAKAQGFTVKDYASVSLDDLKETLNNLPISDTLKSDTPQGPLAAMGRDALTTLYYSDNTTVPMLLALHTGETSPVITEGNSGLMFHIAKREAVSVAGDSAEVDVMNRTMGERESLFASMDALNRLTNTYKQTPK